MNPVVKSYTVLMAEVGLTEAEAPARLTTTLYDAMAALQTVVKPDEDDLGVAVIVRWLGSRRLTCVGNGTVAAQGEMAPQLQRISL
jgi:hypothetical protein